MERIVLTAFYLTLFTITCCVTFGVSPKFAPLVVAPLLVVGLVAIWGRSG